MDRAPARSFGRVFRDLAHSSADLLRGELRLARLEVMEVAKDSARGTALVALGAVLLLLGSLALLTSVILLAGDSLPADQYWLAALAVLVLSGALAAWFARKGSTLLKPSELVPDETLETLKEDKEWLKQQLTSGATSS